MYIYHLSTFFVDKLIISQDVKKNYFLLYHLKNVLTRFLSLLLSFLLASFGLYI